MMVFGDRNASLLGFLLAEGWREDKKSVYPSATKNYMALWEFHGVSFYANDGARLPKNRKGRVVWCSLLPRSMLNKVLQVLHFLDKTIGTPTSQQLLMPCQCQCFISPTCLWVHTTSNITGVVKSCQKNAVERVPSLPHCQSLDVLGYRTCHCWTSHGQGIPGSSQEWSPWPEWLGTNIWRQMQAATNVNCYRGNIKMLKAFWSSLQSFSEAAFFAGLAYVYSHSQLYKEKVMLSIKESGFPIVSCWKSKNFQIYRENAQ